MGMNGNGCAHVTGDRGGGEEAGHLPQHLLRALRWRLLLPKQLPRRTPSPDQTASLQAVQQELEAQAPTGSCCGRPGGDFAGAPTAKKDWHW